MKIEKKYQIFEKEGNTLITPKTNSVRGWVDLFDDEYNTEEEAMIDIEKNGDSYTRYYIVPFFCKK